VQGKFSFNISYSTTVALTPRTIAVAEAFGLGVDEEHEFTVLDVELKIGPADIVYVTGDSGSGKSVLLRAIKKDLGDEAIDVADIQVDREKPLIETVGKTVEEGLELLSRVGLNDAFLFLRSFDQLSDGQKYRYRIARLLESRAGFWVLDEFAATLDRDTAKIVSFNLQKIARLEGKCVIAATTHMDLFQDLGPSVHVHKRFGKEITVNYHVNIAPAECSLVKEMLVEEGSFADWQALSGFHYRSHHIGGPRKIFALKRGDELCGVIVYCYPAPAAHGRRMVLPRMGMKEMNKQLCSITRVVVHPKYRTISLGAKLVRETLKLCGTPCVEMSAVMGKYNPFAEKAGMRRITLQEPNESIVRVSEVLQKVGFNVQLLGSQKCIQATLENLTSYQVRRLKTIFKKNSHPRFLKELNVGRAIFGTREGKDKAFRYMKLPKLAQLIKITGLLLQTKVYLFWP
jgi:ABC-type transport system involved in cytochrome c biogenesis ATPase subunit/GNAT superfamily N-acetyltransferase